MVLIHVMAMSEGLVARQHVSCGGVHRVDSPSATVYICDLMIVWFI